jgi:hypothetical protein
MMLLSGAGNNLDSPIRLATGKKSPNIFTIIEKYKIFSWCCLMKTEGGQNYYLSNRKEKLSYRQVPFIVPQWTPSRGINVFSGFSTF